jgi:hypothetical protein
MPAACPDLARSEPWRRSLERSLTRRARALRRRRRLRGGRSIVTVLILALTLGAGGALAASTGGGSSLKNGSSGPAVVQLQKKLHVTADGAFGPATEKAVRGYQRGHGLTVDGVVGPQTAGALGLSLAVGDTAAARNPHATRSVGTPPILDRIARCESGGNPTAVDPSGTYRGKYQFDRGTWAAMGGSGDPAKASEAEQDRRALKLYQARGASPWPVCGAR